MGLVISGNDVISLESRPLNFRVFIHAYSLRPQTYFRSSLARTKSIQKQEDAFEVYTSASWKDGPGFFSIS